LILAPCSAPSRRGLATPEPAAPEPAVPEATVSATLFAASESPVQAAGDLTPEERVQFGILDEEPTCPTL
jgi:hypothetical protein